MKEIDNTKNTKARVKVIGAGSIGTHLLRGFEREGCSVTAVDNDPEALKRQQKLYNDRYGIPWNDSIAQYVSGTEPDDLYDIICVGTPPDTHLKIAKDIFGSTQLPKLLFIEKPLCTPSLEGLDDFLSEVKQNTTTRVVMGYTYLTSRAIGYVRKLIGEYDLGKILTMDVNIRAHWDDIFKAHWWLAHPKETYLGFSDRGGGALGEHSHGVNLFLHLARVLGVGEATSVQAAMDFVTDGGVKYDRITFLTLKMKEGMIGRVAQDMVTRPTEKLATLQFERGRIEWRGIGPGVDHVVLHRDGKDIETFPIKYNTGDWYMPEIQHVLEVFKDPALYNSSPLSLPGAVETMKVINAAHRSVSDRGNWADV